MKIGSVWLTCMLLLSTLSFPTFVEDSHALNQVVVDFDTYINGTQVPSLEVISNQYAEWAVVFTPFRAYNLSALEPGFASATSNYSEPNVGGLTPSVSFAPYNFINFTAWFKDNSTEDTLYTDFVSVKVGDNNIGTLSGNLTAYNTDGQQIGFAECFTTDQSFHTLTISRPTPDIAYVTFWTDSDGACIDDFTFNMPVVPEFQPSFLLLSSMIVFFILIVIRRKDSRPDL